MPRTYLTKHAIAQIIDDNRHLFHLNATISDQWLCSTFSIPRPSLTDLTFDQAQLVLNTFRLKRAYYYGRLNAILARYGLVIRQRTDSRTAVTTFKVQTRINTRKRLIAYAASAHVKHEQQNRLANGIARYNSILPERIADENYRQPYRRTPRS